MNEKILEEYKKSGLTPKELQELQEICADDNKIYKNINKRLKDYYSGAKDKDLEQVLKKVKKLEEFRIVTEYYKGKTNEKIAAEMNKEIRWIYRVKKRACIKLYWMIIKEKAKRRAD